MPSKFKSPYASSFQSAIKRGTPTFVAVQNIANNKKTTPKVVFNSLFKANLVSRVKFNGEWVYWPVQNFKKNASKPSQWNAWQHFIDWCVFSGKATPKQLSSHKSSQKEFMSWCRKYWNKQYQPTTSKRKNKRKKVSKVNKTKSSKSKSRSKSKGRKSPKRSSSVYKFNSAKSKTTRRYRRAA